jgi:hypothetical protein
MHADATLIEKFDTPLPINAVDHVPGVVRLSKQHLDAHEAIVVAYELETTATLKHKVPVSPR